MIKLNSFYDSLCVSTYIINLPERADRLAHIREQFDGKEEFDVTIVEACRHKYPATGLWLSIKKVVQMAVDRDEDVILICEDDHEFTPHYSRDGLFGHIIGAGQQGANILLGSISSFEQAIPVAEGRFWIDRFLCTQFTVVYRKFFRRILDEPFGKADAADLKLSEMTSHKMVIHPFVSLQHDFGYSDIPIDDLPTV